MRISMGALAVLALGATAMSQPRRTPAPMDLLRRAAEATGGEEALRGLRTLVLDNNAAGRNAGQELDPLGPMHINVSSSRQTLDRAGRRLRADIEIRGINAPTPNGIARLVNVATTDAGMIINAQGRQRPFARLQYQNSLNNLDNFMPVQLLALMTHPDSLAAAGERVINGEPADGVRYTLNGATPTIWFSRRTGLPLQQQTVTDHAILGDLTTTITWSHWSNTAVRIPGQIVTEAGPSLTMVTQRVASINEALSDTLFLIPDSIAAQFRAQPPLVVAATPPVPPVSLSEVAPGVWRASSAPPPSPGGGPQPAGYNALVVDQGDRLVLVEAPLTPAWTRSLLDTLAGRFPGKRVGTLVNTHHHWDHAGGVRAVLAAGIPVVTHERNVEFVRQVGTARKTVRPDALSRRGRLPAITGVSDSLVVGRGDNRVVVYTTETAQDGGAHLVAVVPSSGVLFQSDILTGLPPGRGQVPRAAAREIAQFAQRRGLAIQRVVGGHGEIVEMGAIATATH